MKLTNKHNLPDVFVKAVQNDGYSSTGDISTTTLVDAPQIRVLKQQHEIVMDVSEMLWALLGTAMHNILERSELEFVKYRKVLEVCFMMAEEAQLAKDEKQAVLYQNAYNSINALLEAIGVVEEDPDVITERRLEIEVDGWIISGAQDRYTRSKKLLEDYKVTSTYAYIFPEARKKWEGQQNVYAYMLRANGYEVKKANIIALFRDFSQSKVGKNKDYPQKIVETMPVRLFDNNLVGKSIRKRVHLHKQAELGNVIDCTPKEKWSRPDQFAVQKPGTKRALRVFDEKFLAEDFYKANKSKHEGLEVMIRKGGNKRCEEYCPVRHVCPQRKRELEESTKLTF
jgi:hypothetical protein